MSYRFELVYIIIYKICSHLFIIARISKYLPFLLITFFNFKKVYFLSPFPLACKTVVYFKQELAKSSLRQVAKIYKMNFNEYQRVLLGKKPKASRVSGIEKIILWETNNGPLRRMFLSHVKGKGRESCNANWKHFQIRRKETNTNKNVDLLFFMKLQNKTLTYHLKRLKMI